MKLRKIRNDLNNNCGKTTPNPTFISPLDQLKQMKEELKAQAATYAPPSIDSISDKLLQTVEGLDMNSDRSPEEIIIQDYLSNIDAEEIQSQFSDMKKLMKTYGIEEDDAFIEIEQKINNFDGSGSFTFF